MSVLKRKAEIANLLTAFLERGRQYSEPELDQYIARTLRLEIADDPRLTADHLRRAMIELGYVTRTDDGRSYWVSTTFRDFKQLDSERLVVLDEYMRLNPNGRIQCPYCRSKIDSLQLRRHYLKRHSLAVEWGALMKKYFV